MTDRRVTRRRLLAAGGTAALGGVAGCAATPRRTVETVVAVPGERVPENLAFGPDGALHAGITAGEVRRLAADRTGETGLGLADTDQVAALPGAVGVETAPDGTVYVCVATGNSRSGVWAVPPGGEATRLVGIPGFRTTCCTTTTATGCWSPSRRGDGCSRSAPTAAGGRG